MKSVVLPIVLLQPGPDKTVLSCADLGITIDVPSRAVYQGCRLYEVGVPPCLSGSQSLRYDVRMPFDHPRTLLGDRRAACDLSRHIGRQFLESKNLYRRPIVVMNMVGPTDGGLTENERRGARAIARSLGLSAYKTIVVVDADVSRASLEGLRDHVSGSGIVWFLRTFRWAALCPKKTVSTLTVKLNTLLRKVYDRTARLIRNT